MNKSGMYGELPEVKIGRITVSRMSDKEGDNRLWLLNEYGEGFETSENEIADFVSEYFKKHF